MAEGEEQPAPAIPTSIQSIPGVRQIILLLGLAAAVTVGVAVVIWSQSPTYRVVFPSMDPSEMGAVAGVLENADIDYRINPSSGSLVVAADKILDAQMLLAGQGLPRSKGVSFESLYDANGYSTSQFMESKFYAHALENKLAGIIGSLTAVKAAQVSLGLPKQSVFVRDRTEASASVLVHLYPGRTLESGQVKAIVHLVASSVPDLKASNVTLLDENSTLLSGASESATMGAATSQFEYKSRLEDALAENIETLLVPIMGVGHSRTNVVAQLDFTEIEETTERFDPASQVVRSEQSKEQNSTGNIAAIGIPGALSNQPPVDPAVDPAALPAPGPRNTLRDVTLNYEVDRTISRIRTPKVRLQRLSVAVVLDYARPPGAARNAKLEPLPTQKLDEISGLIKEAVGFNEARGDTLKLSNEPFQIAPAPVALKPPPWWQQAWLLDLGKVFSAALVVLVLVLWVLRPLVQGLVQSHRAQLTASVRPALQHEGGYAGVQVAPREDSLLIAQNLASTDPKRIAQVVKDWVASDE